MADTKNTKAPATDENQNQDQGARIDSLETQLAASKSTNDKLQTRLDTAEAGAKATVAVVGSLEKTIENLLERVGGIEDNGVTIDSASAGGVTIAKAEEPKPAPNTPFTVKKKKYRLRFPRFRTPTGRVITAHEVLDDKSLQEEVVSDYPNVLVEVE